jgi:hypothetical protein
VVLVHDIYHGRAMGGALLTLPLPKFIVDSHNINHMSNDALKNLGQNLCQKISQRNSMRIITHEYLNP